MSRVLFGRITKTQWEQQEEAAVSYADLKASIEEYYDENVAHRDQTDKLVETTMNVIDKSSTRIKDLYKGLNLITQLLKDINNAVKDDPSTNKKIDDAIKTFSKISTTTTTEIALKSEVSSLMQDTSEIKSMMTEIYQAFKVKVEFMINGKMVYLTEQEIQDYWDKEEQIKKSEEQARLLKITSAKAGEKFKKAQDAEHQVLKREYSQKVKRLTDLNKKRAEQYMWTMTNRIKPEPITDVKIHPNTKPIVLSVYRNNDKRNFDVHNPFKFADFGITELEELGPIIEKKKNSIRHKRKHMELEPKVKVHGLECDRSLPKDVPFVNNMVIEEPKYGTFFTDVFGDQAFQRWNDIHKVRLDSLVSYLVMALMVKIEENARFSLKLIKLIADHPDQEKLKSKKVKLEALGYQMY
ncbi:hypothetical protein Tco_0740164 [Tanacetum coccineum]